MTPMAKSLTDELLNHHRLVCVEGRSIDSCVITYGDLCERAGVPQIVRSVGGYLQETAEWCRENDWPPINALAVSADSGVPGKNYDLAPGCALLSWDSDARASIDCRDYPLTVAG